MLEMADSTITPKNKQIQLEKSLRIKTPVRVILLTC